MSVSPYDPSTVVIHSTCHGLIGCITPHDSKRYCITCLLNNQPDCTAEWFIQLNEDGIVNLKFEKTTLCTPHCLVQDGENGSVGQKKKFASLLEKHKQAVRRK